MAKQKRSRAEWIRLVAEADASGLSRRAFAEERGLSPQTLSWWTSRLRREKREASTLVAVDVVADAPSDATFRVELRGARSIVVPADFEETALRRLVVALEGLDAC